MRYGVDVGRSGVKVKSEWSKVFLPPLIGRAQEAQWPMTAEPKREANGDGISRVKMLRLSYQGTQWILGDEQHRMGYSCVYPMEVTKADAATRLLALGGVAACGVCPIAEICCGLPLSMFRDEMPRMLELLCGEHSIGVGDAEHPMRVKAMVVPEGFGVLVTAATSSEGTVDLDTLRKPTVVVDLGHRTTQLGLFRGVRLAPLGFVLPRAMGEVYEKVLQESVDRRLKMPFSPTTHALMGQDLLSEGRLVVNGLTVTWEECLPKLREAAKAIWPEVRAVIQRTLAGVVYERVVVGGGGVHLLADELRGLFGDQVVVVEDRYAQADGYYRCLGIRQELSRT